MLHFSIVYKNHEYKKRPLGYDCIFLYIFLCWHAWILLNYWPKHVSCMWWQLNWLNKRVCVCVRLNNCALFDSKHNGMASIKINPLTPNELYMNRTASLTSKHCILYIHSTNVGTEYFKHALYSPFFHFKMQFVS